MYVVFALAQVTSRKLYFFPHIIFTESILYHLLGHRIIFLNENMWQKIRLVRSRDVFVSFTLILLTIINLVPSGECLYEDQVGKFDW